MKLEDFLQNDFGIVYDPAYPTMQIQTLHIIKNYDGTFEANKEEGRPQEKNLEVSKSSFYKAVMDLLNTNELETLVNHPCKWIREIGKDLAVKDILKKDNWSRPTVMLYELSAVGDAN